ncbi:MAG: hypothetical protein HLUCCO02_05480 [Idiomarinaceae bacterium HL-53]|nr:MAG: hypothetical protein HLUCCO02_05480 [Idiomarinaceae bacterium HL-53]
MLNARSAIRNDGVHLPMIWKQKPTPDPQEGAHRAFYNKNRA